MVTTLQILSHITNKDCANLIINILLKYYKKEILKTISAKFMVTGSGWMDEIKVVPQPFIKRLQNYVLQSNLVSCARIELAPERQINQHLLYWGSPYHISDRFYTRKLLTRFFNTSSKPVIKIANIDAKTLYRYTRYYEEPHLRLFNNTSVPVFNFGEAEFIFISSTAHTVFTEIIEPRKWWEISFDGFLYKFKQRPYTWQIEVDDGDIFIQNCCGMSSFKNYQKKKLPNVSDFRYYLRGLCKENNLRNWEKLCIKDLLTFLILNLN